MSGQDSCQDNARIRAITQFGVEAGALQQIDRNMSTRKIRRRWNWNWWTSVPEHPDVNAFWRARCCRVINLSLIACEIRDRRSICLYYISCTYTGSRLFGYLAACVCYPASSLLLYYVAARDLEQFMQVVAEFLTTWITPIVLGFIL